MPPQLNKKSKKRKSVVCLTPDDYKKKRRHYNKGKEKKPLELKPLELTNRGKLNNKGKKRKAVARGLSLTPDNYKKKRRKVKVVVDDTYVKKEIDDPYRRLNISPDANSQIIQSQFITLISQWHPDKNRSRKAMATTYSQLINDARNRLQDKNEKRFYNNRLDTDQKLVIIPVVSTVHEDGSITNQRIN